jgi:hypothetical protein
MLSLYGATSSKRPKMFVVIIVLVGHRPDSRRADVGKKDGAMEGDRSARSAKLEPLW